MLKFFFVAIIFSLAFSGNLFSQDTLPRISVKNQSGKIIISWQNNYGASITNINIQRSTDSIKRFYTIGTVLNPMNKENGYVDAKSPLGRIFYRVFVAFEGGDYVFSKSYRPVPDTSKPAETLAEMEIIEENTSVKQVAPTGFVPSKFVFTGKDNNVILNLPGAEGRKFSIKFFDENDNSIFNLNTIKEPYLILDKVNFLHSGWFKYQLFDNDILLEKFKFYIPKDGRGGLNGKDPRK
ncbi:MAG: hypothetical protein ABJB11_24035 [Ferruginibacter sp.]